MKGFDDVSTFIDQPSKLEAYPISTQATVNTIFHSATRAPKYVTHAFSKLATEDAEASVGEFCVVGVDISKPMVSAKSDK